MEISHSVFLGILQGITEFLPISSSGHLVLAEYFLGLKVETLKSFDVVVHMGTFFAIIAYFRKDVWELIKAFFLLIFGKLKVSDPYAKLIFYIVIGTIPAAIIGILFEEPIDQMFRKPSAVAMWMIILAVLFMLGEFVYLRTKNHGINWRKALIIGCAQALALIPGISRSGSTIAAGLFQGIKREEAARFSFLLGLPAILGAGLITALKVSDGGSEIIGAGAMLAGFISSFVFGLMSVAFLMRYLKEHRLTVFAIYLMALGLSVFT